MAGRTVSGEISSTLRRLSIWPIPISSASTGLSGSTIPAGSRRLLRASRATTTSSSMPKPMEK